MPTRPTRLIIDTDGGIDDALALILALRSPEVEVVGVSTVSGNVRVEQAALREVEDALPRHRHQEPVDDELARHARHRRLVGAVHDGDHDEVGARQALPEPPPQRAGPRVAVRLEHRDHAAVTVPRGRERRGDLGRVMRVVVEQVGAPDDAAQAGSSAERASTLPPSVALLFFRGGVKISEAGPFPGKRDSAGKARSGKATYFVQIPLQKFPPGRYSMQVNVLDPSSDRVAFTRVPIAIMRAQLKAMGASSGG